MTLPAFADVPALIARGLKVNGAADTARAQAALDDVSTLIRQTAHTTWVDDTNELADVPDIVHAVCCAAARRAYNNPDNLRQETIEGYGDTRSGDIVGGVALTEDEREMIVQASASASPGLWVLGTTRGILETPGPRDRWGAPVMLPTTDGEPIAWLDPSELPPA